MALNARGQAGLLQDAGRVAVRAHRRCVLGLRRCRPARSCSRPPSASARSRGAAAWIPPAAAWPSPGPRSGARLFPGAAAPLTSRPCRPPATPVSVTAPGRERRWRCRARRLGGNSRPRTVPRPHRGHRRAPGTAGRHARTAVVPQGPLQPWPDPRRDPAGIWYASTGRVPQPGRLLPRQVPCQLRPAVLPHR
jgi:hypothetical protein